MKNWDIDFITEDQFKRHVAETIQKYGDSLISYDLKRFNSNIIDIQDISSGRSQRRIWQQN